MAVYGEAASPFTLALLPCSVGFIGRLARPCTASFVLHYLC